MKHLFLILFLATPAYSWEFHPAVLNEMSLDLSKFSCNREPMTPDIPCGDYKGRVAVHFNIGLLNDLLEWKNYVHTEGTDSKFMTVGWQYELALPLPRGVELYIAHHSRHTMDQTQPTIEGRPKAEKFPVEDSIGIRFTLYTRGKK